MSATVDIPTAVAEIGLSRLRPHPKNPRHDVDGTLVASIREQGVLQPIVIAPPIGSDVANVIIDGHRRVAGAKAAGLASVPFTLREDLDTPAKQLAAMLVANGDRKDLSVREEAEAFQQLLDYGMSVTKAAKATGRKPAEVKQLAAVSKLPDKVLVKAHAGQVSFEDAAALAEFVGTEHYARLEKYVGDPGNFNFHVKNAQQAIERGKVLDAVRAYAADAGWTEDTGFAAPGLLRVRGYDVSAVADIPAALDPLKGPHILWVRPTSYPGDSPSWSVCTPSSATDEDDEPEDADAAAQRTQWDLEREARKQREADLATARAVRRTWLLARLDRLVVKPTERIPLLRLMLIDLFDVCDLSDVDEARLAGLPLTYNDDGEDDVPDQNALEAWVATANENHIWKALLVLQFRVSEERFHSDRAHATEIRLGQVLGYQPSDVELALITPEVKP